MPNTIPPRFIYAALLLILSFNLSSHSHGYWPGDTWLLRSMYWLARFSIELLLFYGCYHLALNYLAQRKALIKAGVAFVASSIPFTLALAMLDIATGRPDTYHLMVELETTGAIGQTLWWEWLEALPRHFSFCLLVCLIHSIITPNQGSQPPPPQNIPSPDAPAFTKKLNASDNKDPLRIQAQEHYISVTTADNTELIQYRFGQAIKELGALAGQQVHRSFWVADSNVKGWQQHSQGLRLYLYHGEPVPVSRRFEQTVKAHFQPIAL